ncbi:MAG TPA: clostripain-related cysteine peptidase [Elusimicrobiales bacterium]|nr:clostripain-related cysteine peptidase [Elusimicrobiales bacterium]
MKNILAAAAFLALAPGFSPAASALDLNFYGKTYTANPAAVPAPSAEKIWPFSNKPAAPKEWTVMVFINGKNNLEMAGLYNVNMMEKIGSDKNVNIVVELGRMNGQASGDTDLDGNWTGARRLLVKKDSNENVINSPVVQISTAVDMGDYKRAVDFVKWSKLNYPAKKYMLILWDHGSGWMDPKVQPKGAEKGISFDDETGNYIRTRQIGDILKEAGKVDVLAYDACLMQMGEVAFEVKDNSTVIVGSEETVPGLGYPYNLFLGALAKKPTLTAEELGAVTVEAFNMFYEANKKAGQLSAIRSAKLDGLGVKLAEFSALAKEVNDVDALKAARTGVIRYDTIGEASDPKMTISFYGDLWQYAGLVAANLKGTDEKALALKAKAADLQNYIDKELVVYNKATGTNRAGHAMTESRGISVYLPPAEVRVAQEKLENIFEGKYGDFAFDQAVQWHDYVTYLYAVK